MLRPPADAAPRDTSSTNGTSSSTTSATVSASVATTGAQPASLTSSSGTSRPLDIWEKRRKKRVDAARELVRESLWSDDEDDGMEGDGEDDGME